MTAEDTSEELRGLNEAQQQEKRIRWLQRRDQDTSAVVGVMPLVRGLPARLTLKLYGKLELFKHTKGSIVGWSAHEAEDSVMENGRRVLQDLPDVAYVKLPHAD